MAQVLAQVLVVVASASGRTRRLAEALVEGAREAGAEAHLRDAGETDPAELEAADAVVLGSGVHMAGVEPAMRELLARTSPLWLQGRLVGKIGAAFVSAGAGGRGGAELVLIALHASLAEHGMLLVSMPSRLEGFMDGGSHWGPVAWTNPRGGKAGPTPEHLEAARSHGRYIAETAARWLRGAKSP